LFFQLGATYYFNVNAPANPFWLKTKPVIGQGSALNSTYVTNGGFDVGLITLTIPSDFNYSVIYYVCEFHPAMVGVIQIGGTYAPPSPPNSASHLALGPSIVVVLAVLATFFNRL